MSKMLYKISRLSGRPTEYLPLGAVAASGCEYGVGLAGVGDERGRLVERLAEVEVKPLGLVRLALHLLKLPWTKKTLIN